MPVLIYGAYGYTGELIVREALRRGLRPVLSGRDARKLGRLNDRLLQEGCMETPLELRPSALEEESLGACLAGMEVVVHAAGPFTVTSKPMGRACLASGTHYLDITGEIPVFEKLAAIHDRARERGIMMLPGTGFDVVPSDCLAAHLKRRLPTGTHLTLAIGSEGGGLSRGTIKTMLRATAVSSFLRRDGQIVPSPFGSIRRQVDFGDGPRTAISIPWGDLSTAYHSTGIPDITTLAAYPRILRTVITRLQWVRPLMRTVPVQAMLQAAVDTFLPRGPDEETRRTARSHVWGELQDATGQAVRAVASGPEGYRLTAVTTVDIAMKCLRGEARPGFQTPSTWLGPDYPLSLDGFSRRDL